MKKQRSKKPEEKSGSLSEKLRELRLAHGYKQADIAGALDIKQGTYSNYETGKRTPASKALFRIANFYGLTADDLMKMCIPLDREVFYDAPEESYAVQEVNDRILYDNSTKKKPLSPEEKALLFWFSKLDPQDKQEVTEFAIFKQQRKKS